MERSEVYKLIDGEREYQDSLRYDGVNARFGDMEHEVGEYLVMFATYLRKAEDGWTLNKGNDQALHQIRKLATIAVRCMEEHGAPTREQ